MAPSAAALSSVPCFFLPVVISFVAIGTVWGFMLQYQYGAVNVALKTLGLGSLAFDWLGDPRFAMWSIILVDIWKWTGFHVVIYLAGLQSLPGEVEEAAVIDGANPWQRFWYVTVPLMQRYNPHQRHHRHARGVLGIRPGVRHDQGRAVQLDPGGHDPGLSQTPSSSSASAMPRPRRRCCW